MKNKKGFTLLELIVVVLIIGILAGIALPQYRNAVRKARLAEAQITLRTIVDATDRYFLSNESFSGDLNDLDIEVQSETGNWEFYVDECSVGSNGIIGCLVIANPKRETDYWIEYYSTNYWGGEEIGLCGNFVCTASNDNGPKICKALGGELLENYDNSYKL